MDNNERFIARRGTHGDWHWQGQPPPEPGPPRRIPLVERFRENRPRVAVPWSRIALPRPKLNLRKPLAVFAGLVLAALVAVSAIVAIEAVEGDSGSSSGIISNVTKTPAPAETVSPEATPTPLQSAAPSTETPSTETPARQTPAPQTAAPTPVISVTSPQGAVSVAYWSNTLNKWWFGDLTDSVASYQEGQDIPFIVRWDGVAGDTYWLRIVYDCRTPDTLGTIDYLSGIQDWNSELLSASYGPGTGRPNGAIPVPDTPNFDPDSHNLAVFTLYGAKFPVLPLPPHPDDNCDFQRTQDLPIQAYGGPIVFLGSGHLGTATVYSGGKGASTASVPFGLHVTVDGVGRADVMVDPSAIADVER